MFAKGNIKFDFDVLDGIVIKRHFGNITISDIHDAWEWAFDNKIAHEGTKKYLLDYTNALILDIAQTTELVIKYYKENIDRFRNSKVAIVSTNPKNIAFTMLMCRVDDGYSVRPFSTKEMAVEWLKE